MYNHNKAQQSKNRVHISWDILYVHMQTIIWIKYIIYQFFHSDFYTISLNGTNVNQYILNTLQTTLHYQCTFHDISYTGFDNVLIRRRNHLCTIRNYVPLLAESNHAYCNDTNAVLLWNVSRLGNWYNIIMKENIGSGKRLKEESTN